MSGVSTVKRVRYHGRLKEFTIFNPHLICRELATTRHTTILEQLATIRHAKNFGPRDIAALSRILSLFGFLAFGAFILKLTYDSSAVTL